jgi:hypothetical protein
MSEIKTIPIDAELLPTSTLNQNYILHEFPSRVCLVCGKLEKEEAKVVFTGDAWLCGRCKNTLLKLVEENEEKCMMN